MHEFLTTKEVAALLRVKERKIYELVSERAIPASRVTGKLLFPRVVRNIILTRALSDRSLLVSVANLRCIQQASRSE